MCFISISARACVCVCEYTSGVCVYMGMYMRACLCLRKYIFEEVILTHRLSFDGEVKNHGDDFH